MLMDEKTHIFTNLLTQQSLRVAFLVISEAVLSESSNCPYKLYLNLKLLKENFCLPLTTPCISINCYITRFPNIQWLKTTSNYLTIYM